MKTLPIACSFALLAAVSLATNTSAQRYDARIDVPRIVNPERYNERDLRGGDWGRRARSEIDRLNGEVAQVRREIGNNRNPRILERFRRVRIATERLNYAFQRRAIRGWEVRRRADEIRGELDRVRRELRGRYGERGWQ